MPPLRAKPDQHGFSPVTEPRDGIAELPGPAWYHSRMKRRAECAFFYGWTVGGKTMNSTRRWHGRVFFVCLLAGLMIAEGACAASRYGGASRRDRRLSDAPESSGTGSSGTKTEETVRLGMFLRKLGEEGVEGLVLMNGMEDIQIAAPSGRRSTAEKMAGRIAEIVPCQVEETEKYCFLYPQGFEALTQIQLASLDPAYDAVTAEIVFGANLPLYMVLTWISQATGKTIVADNLAAVAMLAVLADSRYRVDGQEIWPSARAIGMLELGLGYRGW